MIFFLWGEIGQNAIVIFLINNNFLNNLRVGEDFESGYGHRTKRKQNAAMVMNSLVTDLKYLP